MMNAPNAPLMKAPKIRVYSSASLSNYPENLSGKAQFRVGTTREYVAPPLGRKGRGEPGCCSLPGVVQALLSPQHSPQKSLSMEWSPK